MLATASRSARRSAATARDARGLVRRAAPTLLAALSLVAAAPAAVAKDPPKSEEVKTALGEAIDAAVRRATGGEFWGTVLVARAGKIELAKGYGFADYDAKPNAPDSIFELASASKQVTATAILRLEQQKKLRTSDSIGKHFKDAPKDKQAITIDHLLHHTSGLDKELGVSYAWTGARDQYVREMLEKPLEAEPGTKFSYSNVGYALLAALVEVVTGKPFEDYVRKELFAPAGLVDTGFIKDQRLVSSDRITRRKCDDCDASWTAANWFWGWGYRGMGGVVTTALDVLAWDRALRGDKVLGPAAKEKLYTPSLDHYACGWKVETTDRGTRKAHHSGGVRGYGTQIARWLEEDALVVVLSNGKTSPVAVEEAIAALLFKPSKITADIDVEGCELTKYRAHQTKEGLAFEVGAVEGDVLLRLREREHALVSIRMSKGTAKALATQIESALASSAYANPDERAAMEGGVFLGFLGDRGTKIHLDDGLALRVQPRYEGVGEGGKKVEDERAVLILDSTKDHGWPVMVHMNPKATKALLESIRKL